MARGYLNRPELVAEKFVPALFHGEYSGRFYRTGDFGRCRADGTIEFLGRRDQQVKLHGHRIELGEIESVLCQHDAVRECVVQIWEPGPDDRRLAAYIVPAGPAGVSAVELRRFLEARLPGYMVPAALVFLESIPLTPNGKINRAALPGPDAARPRLEAECVPPQTEIEAAIANIWREVLGLAQVGVEDHFFELGGSSLLLMQVHARLCQALRIEIPAVRLFENPTIAALARFLAGKQRSLSGVHERAARQRRAFAGRSLKAITI